MAKILIGPLLAALLLSLLRPPLVSAHYVINRPTLGQLILTADLILRGTISLGSNPDRGVHLATLQVHKVLKGDLSAKEIFFASDPDHGARYARGERVVVFLTQATGQRVPPFTSSRPLYFSPQLFGTKFPITSFDPTGYDGLISGMLAATHIADPSTRLTKMKEVMLAKLHSHEKKVRLYAAQKISTFAKKKDIFTHRDWQLLQAYIADDKNDADIRETLRRLVKEGAG